MPEKTSRPGLMFAFPDDRNVRIKSLSTELAEAQRDRLAAMAEVVKLREKVARLERAAKRRKGARP